MYACMQNVNVDLVCFEGGQAGKKNYVQMRATYCTIYWPISHLLCVFASAFNRLSMSLRSSSTRNVHMTTWRLLMGTVTRQPSWVDCVAVRSQSSWSPQATRCTFASFLMLRYKGRDFKRHTPQVCICVFVSRSIRKSLTSAKSITLTALRFFLGAISPSSGSK